MSAQVAADLRAAADVLEQDGWVQGRYYVPDTGCHCALGAIALIASNGRSHFPESFYFEPTSPRSIRLRSAVHATERLIAEDSLDEFNDRAGRTVDEVADLLRAAADASEVSQ